MKESRTKKDLLREIDDLKKEISRRDKTGVGQDRFNKGLGIVLDALESTLNGVMITDVDDTIIYVNWAFINMFEYKSKTDIIGKYAPELFVARKISTFSDIESAINRNGGNTSEFYVFRKNGSTFPVEVSTSMIADAGGKIIGRIASMIDITERKNTEEENRRLSSMILKSQELERQRVAKDLHDDIAQTILAAKLNFIAYQKDPAKHRECFKVGLDYIDKASQGLREVCNDLYPSILSDYGLESAIRWHVRNYLELNNIKTDITIDIKNELSSEVQINLYRIIKEIFSNIIRHSRADRVDLRLYDDNNSIFLVVKDNGIGFSVEDANVRHKGFGLSNIRQRVKELSGTLFIERGPESGTLIEIKI